MSMNQSAFESTSSEGSNALSIVSIWQLFLILRFTKLETLFCSRDSLEKIRNFWGFKIIDTLIFKICFNFFKSKWCIHIIMSPWLLFILDRFCKSLRCRYKLYLEVYLSKNCKCPFSNLQLSGGSFYVQSTWSKYQLYLSSCRCV